jgi:hypothetical protein
MGSIAFLGGGRFVPYHCIHITSLDYQTPTSALLTRGREEMLGLSDSILL